MRQSLLFLLLLGSLAACEKVIDIDLNSTDPRLVVEADLLPNQTPALKVKLTQTVNFSDTMAPPPQSGALVVVIDENTSQRDTALEVSPGNYRSGPDFRATSGGRYALEITHNDKFYRATAVMPAPIALDSVIIEPTFGPGGLPGQFPEQRNVLLYAIYQDPPQDRNFYQIRAFQNDTLTPNLFLYNDEINSGTFQVSPVFVQTWINGVIDIELQHIDEATYRYFTNLNANIGQSSASPANPISNISGGALGYFKAYQSTRQRIQLQEPPTP
jgi:hypothetical protein